MTTPISGSLGILLQPHVYAARFTAPAETSQIVSVLIFVQRTEAHSRFDLGKQIFLDDVPGFDRAAFNQNERVIASKVGWKIHERLEALAEKAHYQRILIGCVDTSEDRQVRAEVILRYRKPPEVHVDEYERRGDEWDGDEDAGLHPMPADKAVEIAELLLQAAAKARGSE